MSYRGNASFGRSSVAELHSAMTKGERRLFWLAIINFVTFVAIAMLLGGDALNGTARDGRYFLMQHGDYTEVSRPVFLYSVVHTVSTIVLMLVAVAIQFRARCRARSAGG